MNTLSSFVSINPDIQFGKPVFKGTRVPVESLFWHLEKGITIKEFIEDFPSVTKEQAEAVIGWVQKNLLYLQSSMMKLLLDENVPVKLKYRSLENDVTAFTTRDMKWLGKSNGKLLQEMISGNFSFFLTIDNNLSFQNNFKNYPIGVGVKTLIPLKFTN